MRTIIPPIKSQGIKTKLVPWIKALMPQVEGRWIEPFLGTGVVAFNMGFSEAILNDINPHVIRFYESIKNGQITPGRVREFLEKEGNALRRSKEKGYEHYRFIRDRFNTSFDPLDFLFLSRTAFNGMIRFNKEGKWNIPFCQKPNRFDKSYITKIVNQVNNVVQVIQDEWVFTCKSFEEIIPLATSEDIIYCDPPYIGRYVDYYNGWDETNEEKLFELLSSTKAKFILSTWHHNDYRENEAFNKYWSHFPVVTRDHFYHSGGKIENRNAIVEALVFNFESDIDAHNHGIKEKKCQPLLF